uniref:Uncharacterized protein n=1 Tax=Nelumbo nucifera TaxID=4432 RepID=A0A822YU61_NELNU|nr:TPA_asm: hypothetical protein HUJ06_011629 [Nelumbo nucifera]
MVSPGRADKFPPPLTRFGRKKNDVVETQEPFSPKDTCMGQVRVRRSKQVVTKAGLTDAAISPKCTCRWIQEALFCNCSAKRLKPRTSSSVWRRWLLFFQLGYRKKVEDPTRRELEP